MHVVADVGVQQDVARIAATAVPTYGRFDTWVDNAGLSIFGTIDQVSIEDVRRVCDTVFWGSCTARSRPCGTTPNGPTATARAEAPGYAVATSGAWAWSRSSASTARRTWSGDIARLTA